jgi:UDP-glucose:(heptosyl)LPS alpha-1,3-glucosyltransferase
MNFDIKGLDAVMAGLGQLQAQERQFPWKLLVVGKGNEGHYRRMAQSLDIADRIVFAGVVDRPMLERIYRASDLYVMLSKFDTFGLVVLEAMAAGLPVLISRTVGARDIVREGQNGFVIEDTGNIQDISYRLRIMLDEQNRRRMAQAARETARQYSWEDTARKVEIVYRELLHGSVDHHRHL